MWIATRQDLIALGGLPASAYQPDEREVSAFWPSQNLIELRGHGLSGSSVRFTATPGATLPTALQVPPPGWQVVVATTDPDFFSLVGVTLTDTGSGSIACLEDYWPKIDAKLLAWTSWLVAHAKAYAGPWTTPPDWAPGLVARLVAFDVATALRLPTARYPIDDVRKRAEADMEFCKTKLDEGAPYGDGKGPIDASPLVAENGAVVARPRHPGPFRPPIPPIGGAPHLIIAGERFGDPRFRV
jgi:hypothetical protein